MVPQQQDSPSSSGQPTFGSLLIDKNSSTPYSDATQVITRTHTHNTRISLLSSVSIHEKRERERKSRGVSLGAIIIFSTLLPGSLLGRGRWRCRLFRMLAYFFAPRAALKVTGNSAGASLYPADLDLENFSFFFFTQGLFFFFFFFSGGDYFCRLTPAPVTNIRSHGRAFV